MVDVKSFKLLFLQIHRFRSGISQLASVFTLVIERRGAAIRDEHENKNRKLTIVKSNIRPI